MEFGKQLNCKPIIEEEEEEEEQASERAGKSDWDFSCGGAASERSFH